jgi:hypothetical protein
MADSTSKTSDASEKFGWKLFFLLLAGAVAFIGAAMILAPTP